MENKIKLAMLEDKSIEIYVNDISKLIIPENSRELSAQDIYELLDYKNGDKYSVETENEKKKDEPVLIFFDELIGNICKSINELDLNEEDEILNLKEEKKGIFDD